MLYASDLRRATGEVLAGGGRIIAELVAAARERRIEVPYLVPYPDVDLEPDEIAAVLELETELRRRGVTVPRQEELAAFLRAGGAIDVVNVAVPASAWIEDALRYYQRLAFFATGLPADYRDDAPFAADDELILPTPEIEAWFVGLDRDRIVPFPVYPWPMQESCVAFVEALARIARGAVRIEGASVTSRDDVTVDARVNGARLALSFHYESKYALRVDSALPRINRAIQATGMQFLVSREAGGFALLRPDEAARISADRAVPWNDPARVIC